MYNTYVYPKPFLYSKLKCAQRYKSNSECASHYVLRCIANYQSFTLKAKCKRESTTHVVENNINALPNNPRAYFKL